MLQVQADQMEAFSKSKRKEANARLVAYAKRRFPSKYGTEEDAVVLEQVISTRETARKYGVQREDDVATFFDLSVMYGQEFPDSDWAQDILACDELHGPDKMAVLRFRVIESGTSL